MARVAASFGFRTQLVALVLHVFLVMCKILEGFFMLHFVAVVLVSS